MSIKLLHLNKISVFKENVFRSKTLDEDVDVKEFCWTNFIRCFHIKPHRIRPEDISIKPLHTGLGIVYLLTP